MSCSSSCSELNTVCRVASCDTSQGICISKARVPIPAGCCITNQQCVDANECTLDICNVASNICEPDWICDGPIPTPFQKPQRSCSTSLDCDDLNFCTVDTCTAGICINTPGKNLGAGCCVTRNDCETFSCTNAFCSSIDYRCIYQKIDNCNNNDGVSASTSNGSPSSSKNNNSSGSGYNDGDIISGTIGLFILLLVILSFCGALIFLAVRSVLERNQGAESSL